MKKQVIAYVHSHWDREWYREFEIFRMRLLKVFDKVLDMLENGKLPSFYFDGQVAALLDYLEIRPEKEGQIKQLVKDKKLFIGPFYCLVDEFLTDENCFRKNLEIGLKISKEFGCEDFTAYFADTFGHTSSTLPILREFGINSAVVWRGCGDIPSEFEWGGINTVNLIRGYFNDVFSTGWNIEKKAEFLKDNLDKIAEKSGNTLLLPIGADHLGVEVNLVEQVNEINKLLDDYEIKIGSIFEYINSVKDRFSEYKVEGELRDNSKTFLLEGSYSSRLDLKRRNIISCHKLDMAEKLVHHTETEGEYSSLIEYAYKLLLQNQAHDSICGCSTDDVHSENITRYKKICQIADNIIEDIRFKNGYKFDKIVNLSDKPYSGLVGFKSDKDFPYQILDVKNGFPQEILQNTQRIPVTEDYTEIKTYALSVKNVVPGEADLSADSDETDVFVADNSIGNSHIFMFIENDEFVIGNKTAKFIDYTDNGDSYNTGYTEEDMGKSGKILSSRVLCEGKDRSVLWVEVEVNNDILNIEVGLNKFSAHLDFDIKWKNTSRNHLLEFVIDTAKPVEKTYSEDFGNIIEREFDPDYDVRKHLPKEKGKEVKTNTAPMRRGVCANGVGVVTTGLTQYEVFGSELRIPVLRATGVISNPKNPSRSTPAGPPIETEHLQQLGENHVNLSVFMGDNLKDNIDNIFNKCVIL
ncbi:MAG: hypothetical protein K6E29_02160 [Cyanobacteria bacterium RUI128]|nr:hypothetical protein [Cyanobacteria bacterium RUI128]